MCPIPPHDKVDRSKAATHRLHAPALETGHAPAAENPDAGRRLSALSNLSVDSQLLTRSHSHPPTDNRSPVDHRPPIDHQSPTRHGSATDARPPKEYRSPRDPRSPSDHGIRACRPQDCERPRPTQWSSFQYPKLPRGGLWRRCRLIPQKGTSRSQRAPPACPRPSPNNHPPKSHC